MNIVFRLTLGGLVALCGLAGSAADAARPVAADDRRVVVATTSILADITRHVAGDQVEVITLIPAGADPHGTAISAAESAELLRADLVVANGLGLEGGLAGNLAAADAEGVTVLEVAPQVDPLPYGAAAGDDAGSLDPHVWTDPRRMIDAARLIEAELVGLDGIDGDQLARSADAYTTALQQLDADLERELAVIPAARRHLITNHNVFAYFAERYDFTVVGTVIPSGTTLASPSAADLADLVEVIDEVGVPAIFADSSQPTQLADVLVAEAGVDVEVVALYTESLGPPGSGADTYVTMMRSNGAAIVEALTRPTN